MSNIIKVLSVSYLSPIGFKVKWHSSWSNKWYQSQGHWFKSRKCHYEGGIVKDQNSTIYNHSKYKSDFSVKGTGSVQNYIHISICTFFFGINLTNDNSSTTATFILLHNVWYQYSRLDCFGNFWPLKIVGYHNLTPYNHSKNRPMECDVKYHKSFECVLLITNWF